MSLNSKEKMTIISTNDKNMIMRLEELEREYPDECSVIMRETTGTVKFMVPKSWVEIKRSNRNELNQR